MIRLARIGKKKYPTYRIIVSDKQKDTKGSYLESLGQYNPHVDPSVFEVDKERLNHWLGVGAQLSDTVHNLCVTHGVLKAEKRSVLHKKKKQEGEGTEAPQVQAPAETPKAADVAAPEAPAPEAKQEEKKEEPEKKEEAKTEDKK